MYCKKLVTFVHNIDWDLLKTLIPAWPTQLMMCASNFDLGVINVIVLWEKSDLQPAVKAYMQIYYCRTVLYQVSKINFEKCYILQKIQNIILFFQYFRSQILLARAVE